MSIKGHNSVVNLRKTKIYITNVDIVNDNVYTKFGLNLSICIKIRSKNQILTSIKGHNSVVNLQKNNSSKFSCTSFSPARMRMIESKMKELECSQDFSHNKSMEIFPDTQGQLTPQSLVRSGQISNSFEISLMSLLPASMKKI